MKKIIVMAFASFLMVSACKRKIITPINNDITQDVPYEEVVSVKEAFKQLPFLPPPGTIFATPIPIPFPPKGYATEYEANLAKYNATVDMVKKVEITEMSIEVLTPAGQTLDFVDSPRMYIFNKEKTTPLLVAHKLPVPKGLTKVLMDRENVEFKPYFTTDSMFLKMTAYLNSIPDTNTTFKIKTNMRLTLSSK